MSLRWLFVIVSAIALILPLPAFYSRKRRYRDLHELDIERRNGGWWPTWKQMLRFPGHWIELVRGFGASLGMLAADDELQQVSQFYRTHAAWFRFVLPLALAIFCVILIALLFRYPGKSIAPVSFVGATLLVLVPLPVSLPAVLLGSFCAFALRSLPAFFLALVPTLALLGFLLDRQLWPSLAGAVFAAVPVVIAFSQHRLLVIPVRRLS